MDKLFIELYVDEDVNVIIADLVKARGFTAVTTREAGMLQKSDTEQLIYANSQQKAFLTHNRTDFEKLAQEYVTKGQTHSGIILATRRPVYELARKLLLLLNQVTADEIQNQVRYI